MTSGWPAWRNSAPGQLTDHVDATSPGAGARNAAVLFAVASAGYAKGLLRDLDRIIEKPAVISGSALAALLPGAATPRPEPLPPLVMPRAANPAQRAVLRSAMTERLTVATGPPGTGKSQLVVDAAATAITAGQSVLVASTNNQAVDEVWERCEQIMPGLLVRTGSGDNRDTEAHGLKRLLGAEPPERSPETRRAAHQHATRQLGAVETELCRVAEQEAELLALGRARTAATHRVGQPADQLARLLGARWGARARALAEAWFFGEWRRRRFLRPTGLPATDGTSETCTTLADLDEIDDRWRTARAAVESARSDIALTAALAAAEQNLERASAELLTGAVRDNARTERQAIENLRRAQGRQGSDWGEVRRALPHVRGWAVTSLSAQRFPFGAALFDLVIIDEASQCGIPAVVPLLFQARRALVIGDAMQLPHISTLPAQTDAALRRRHVIAREWLAEHQLSPVRHSAFAATEHAAGGSLLLDEHYRCHPDIAAVPNRLFYGGRLTVLTDVRGRPALDAPAIIWKQVHGHAQRGPGGASWRNLPEVKQVLACVEELLAKLPTAEIGVVTPYRAQVDELDRRLRDHDRVQLGTVHTFQGGERDVMVLSLVAAANGAPRRFDWIDQQRELWNVAITRARSHLVVVGDEALWERRGGVGAELLRAARAPESALGNALDDDLAGRLYGALSEQPGVSVELGVAVNGHRADAVLTADGRDQSFVVDLGTPVGMDPTTHLRRMLRQRELLGADTVRLPAWRLIDSGDASDRLDR